MDHFHRSIVQRLLYQDLGPFALSPDSGTDIQQGLRYRHLGRDWCHCGLFPHGCVVTLLHLRSSLVLLDGMGLYLERVMALF